LAGPGRSKKGKYKQGWATMTFGREVAFAVFVSLVEAKAIPAFSHSANARIDEAEIFVSKYFLRFVSKLKVHAFSFR